MIDKFSWISIFPELILLVMTCVIIVADLFDKNRLRPIAYHLTWMTLLVLTILTANYALDGQNIQGFGGMVISDVMGNWLKSFAALALLVTYVYGRGYIADRGMLRGGEWYTLGLLSLLGIFVIISANNFLLVYLGVELLGLATYALIALRRENTRATEAAMKYFILGAIGSGLLLYGLSMLYGATGTLDIPTLFEVIRNGDHDRQILVFGLVFLVAGIGFKFGAVPFHVWVPDVYEGAPTAVVLLLGAAPELATFALAMRLLVAGLLPMAADWQAMLGVLAVGSLLIGNVVAIAQTNLKRMLAYSTISHMGYVILGLMSGVVASDAQLAANAYSSAMFYMVIYVLTTLVSFGMIMLLARQGFEAENIKDFAGLNKRHPLWAAVMALCMFSLAGIPPLVGFPAKLSVLQALVSTGLASYIALAVFAVMMSLIGAFYYIRVVKVMYFDTAPDDAQVIRAPLDMRCILSINGVLLLILGIVPGGLMALCYNAIRQMLGG